MRHNGTNSFKFNRWITQNLLRILIAIFAVGSASALAQDEIGESVDTLAALGTESAEVAAPPTNIRATDHEYDNGQSVDLIWTHSVDDTVGNSTFFGYNIFRNNPDGSADSLAMILAVGDAEYTFTDNSTEKDVSYTYSVNSVSAHGISAFTQSPPVVPDSEWINLAKSWQMFFLVVLAGSVIWYIYHAKRGKDMFLRKIAGLSAVEEAIGRATEMGRPILFIPGIHDMDDVQTIAGMTILSRVAKQTADYDSRIIVPTRASLAMTAARETVREAYMTAGRPDAYRQDDIYYVTDEQFGYVAAVNGIMTRDKPATCFYMGAFFAESLILAETGNSIGAIQIAGTAMPAQLPFFVAACDYTLIGEELFAASAYLSGEPKQLGSLKGQDVGKAVAMIAILAGAALATLGSDNGLDIEVMRRPYELFLWIFSGH